MAVQATAIPTYFKGATSTFEEKRRKSALCPNFERSTLSPRMRRFLLGAEMTPCKQGNVQRFDPYRRRFDHNQSGPRANAA
jgi:hypothetical protein